MKFIDTLGRAFQPGLIGEVPTGNLVWVDAVNGNDALAVRGRQTVPFKTLTAAKSAAVSGDTIMVMPGTYNEQDLFKAGVNWHFLSGAKVGGPSAGDALFLVTGADTLRVTGEGEFYSGAVNYVLSVTGDPNPGADVIFKARSISGLYAAIHVEDTGATVRVEADVLEAEGSPVDVRGGVVSVRARLITCDDYAAIYVQGGEAKVTAQMVKSANSCGIQILGGSVVAEIAEVLSTWGTPVMATGGAGLLRCLSLRSEYAAAIVFSGGSLHVVGAKIYSGSGGDTAIYVTSDGLTLRNCWINTSAPASIGTDGSDYDCKVVSTVANQDVDAHTALLVSTFSGDSDVTD